MVLKKLKTYLMATCAAATIACQITSANANEVILDSTAAVVNSDIILESELNKTEAEVLKNFKQRGASINEITARRAALEQLVTRSIILQIGEKAGLSLTDSQINDALAQASMRTKTSVANILKSYGNIPESQARQLFAEDLIINEVRNNQVRRRIRISDAEVQLLAKTLRTVGNVEPSYHLAQIIVPLSPTATPAQVNAATSTANKIKNEARHGADFTALAAEYAQGSTASQGGDLGYIPETQVPPPFLPAILKANPGEVVGPIRSPYGLHLLKLYDVSHQAVEPITTYKARHILLTTSVVFSDDAAKSQLEALRRQIESGAISFANAAKKYSEDPGSASLGGELGYAPASRYDPAFAQALVSLRPGQISQPIKSSFGWHLIELEDKKIDKNSEEAYEQRARDLIFRRLFTQETQAWEKEIRASAYVHVTDPELVQAGLDKTIDSENEFAPQK